jgi:hypothetical protein
MLKVGVIWYHATRALGFAAGSRGLLADADHVVNNAWVVSTVDGEPFNLPRHDVSQALSVERGVGLAPMPELDQRRSWILLAGGHAREVLPVGSNVTGRYKRLELQLGPENLAPTVGGAVLTAGPEELPTEQRALALYSELGSHLRALIDVRFKLLAIVPTVSGIALGSLITRTPDHLTAANRAVLATAALVGFLVVLGVRIYDVRNSELHDDLISRGRKVEETLGIERGVYTLRRRSVFPVQHDTALGLVYGVVLLAWLATAVVYAFGLGPAG